MKINHEKIKVLQLITGLNRAGAEKVVFDIASVLNKEKFEVMVLGLSADKEMLNDFVNQKIKVKTLDAKKNILSFWHAFKQISSIIQQEKIKLIHAHLVHAYIMAVLLKFRHPSVKLVFTSHSFNLETVFRRFFVSLTKMFRSTDILFSKEMHTSSYRKDAHIIPNGVASANYALDLPKNDCFTFLCIGRLSPEKNQAGLLIPARKLKEKGKEFQLLLIGTGPERDKLAAEIKRYQLEKEVQLLGLRSDTSTLYNQAHCLIIPSIWEGMPMVLLEGGASSLPLSLIHISEPTRPY